MEQAREPAPATTRGRSFPSILTVSLWSMSLSVFRFRIGFLLVTSQWVYWGELESPL
jgi:hypothetical protein